MLRFSEAERQTWGVNFRREIARLSEVDDWVMVPREESGSVRHFGLLRGLRGIRPLRNVQVTPYSLSRMTTSEADGGGLAYDRNLDVGADLKLGLSSNVTLDATINPDFGQVEADPAELNLTTYETFFPEKRPFFIEGVQIFDYDLGIGGEGSLLYTRRVGGAASPIIGAAKLSGRTGGGLSFGGFGAATGASFDPERYYGVARLKQEFGGQSYVGGMATGYGRAGAPGVERRSLAGGVDWDLRWRQNTYGLRGHLTTSSVARPGTDAGTRTGFGTFATLERLRGSLTWMASFRVFSDRFNPNDLGRLLVNDWVRLTGQRQLPHGREPALRPVPPRLRGGLRQPDLDLPHPHLPGHQLLRVRYRRDGGVPAPRASTPSAAATAATTCGRRGGWGRTRTPARSTSTSPSPRTRAAPTAWSPGSASPRRARTGGAGASTSPGAGTRAPASGCRAASG